jgi:NTE family protein
MFSKDGGRVMTGSRIGLALGSGSARGWSHIGVIEALDEAGIKPDIVCGCSIGALVGAAYVAGRLTELRQWAEKATWREIVALMDVQLTGGGLIEGKHVVAFLRGLGIEDAIETYTKKYAAVATDLVTGREIWLETGPIYEAVRASIALPGIFSPARIDGKWLVDGGLSNPVPVSVCRALGADLIIAVNLNGDLLGRRFTSEPRGDAISSQPPVPAQFLDRMIKQLPAPLREPLNHVVPRLLSQGSATPGYFDVLANSINIMQDHITRARLAGEPPHVMLVPRLSDIALLEFHRAEEAMTEGRYCVEQALPILRYYAQRAGL